MKLWIVFLTGCAVLLGLQQRIEADILLYCTEEGDHAVLEIQPEDTLQTLTRKVEDHFALHPSEQALIFLNDSTELSQIYCIKTSALEGFYSAVSATKKIQSLTSASYRNYDNPLTADEKSTIAYIVNTLANNSYARLLLMKGDLDRAGAKIDHVHPLRHIAAIFSDEQLKVNIRNIKKKSLVWKNYVSGLGNSLSEEAARNNLTSDFVEDFARTLKLDPSHVQPMIGQQSWSSLIDYLIDAIPRQGNPRRYDM